MTGKRTLTHTISGGGLLNQYLWLFQCRSDALYDTEWRAEGLQKVYMQYHYQYICQLIL